MNHTRSAPPRDAARLAWHTRRHDNGCSTCAGAPGQTVSTMDAFVPAGIGGAYQPQVVETHSSLVFFVGDRAYKLKKALDLGFVDLRTVEQRRIVCQREVELNRRLSPDVYLGVAAVHPDADPSAPTDTPDGDGPCDHLVVMRRMPPDRRLSTLVVADELPEGALDSIAELLAEFHGRAEHSRAADLAAGADALARRWSNNTAALRGFTRPEVPTPATTPITEPATPAPAAQAPATSAAATPVLDAGDVESVEFLAQRWLSARHRLFDSRISAGRACDGHGDLLADDIFVLDDGPRILDCLEFDDSLRLDDVLADVGFLAMDLERLGRPDLAAYLLDRYRIASGDYWPASLAHHHIAYRAQVRAKVSAIRSAQGDPTAADLARRLLGLARSHLQAARARLVLVGGLPGTGKSTLARAIAERTGATVLRSDVIRKQLAHPDDTHPAGARFGQGLYSPTSTEATYAEMLGRARHALQMGELVVLDASWTSESQRLAALRMAGSVAADVIQLHCVAPTEVTTERIRARSVAGTDASDADEEVASAMAAVADPWPGATTIDTGQDVSVALGEALAHIGPL